MAPAEGEVSTLARSCRTATHGPVPPLVSQDPLPNTALGAISGQLQSYTDACEALHVTEVTLGFLSTAGENPNMDLAVYVQDKLRMSEQTEQVLKVGLASRLSRELALPLRSPPLLPQGAAPDSGKERC